MISRNACLDAPTRPSFFKDDLGVKKRVKDLGVIVGGLRCLQLVCFSGRVKMGDEVGSSPSVDAAVHGNAFSWDPSGLKLSISIVYNVIVRPRRLAVN